MRQLVITRSAAVVAAAETSLYLRVTALEYGLITLAQALDMPGGPIVLFREAPGWLSRYIPYFSDALYALDVGWPAFGEPAVAGDLAAFGRYLIDHPGLPWLHGKPAGWDTHAARDELFAGKAARLNTPAYLGGAAMLAIMEETGQLSAHTGQGLGPLRPFAAYLNRRQGRGRRTELPELRVPDEFKSVFREWAEGAVNFVAPD